MRIRIVGLGYVGLPLAAAFCEADQEVVGVDTDARVVDAPARGESLVEDVPAESLGAAGARFKASTRYADPGRTDFTVRNTPKLVGGLTPECLPDCTAVVTAHPDLDLERLVGESTLLVDFRGVTRGIEAPNLVRL